MAHNEWVDGRSRARVVHGFGREDQLDREALKRLVNSISRYLEPEDAERARAKAGVASPFSFLGSKQLGGTHLLDGVWQRLNIEGVLKKPLKGTRLQGPRRATPVRVSSATRSGS